MVFLMARSTPFVTGSRESLIGSAVVVRMGENVTAGTNKFLAACHAHTHTWAEAHHRHGTARHSPHSCASLRSTTCRLCHPICTAYCRIGTYRFPLRGPAERGCATFSSILEQQCGGWVQTIGNAMALSEPTLLLLVCTLSPHLCQQPQMRPCLRPSNVKNILWV